MSQRPQLSREIVMETIRAINIIAAAEEAGVDGTRTPGGVALNKQSQKIHLAAVQAVIILQANGLNPDDDLATQTPPAAAVARQITGKHSHQQEQPEKSPLGKECVRPGTTR